MRRAGSIGIVIAALVLSLVLSACKPTVLPAPQGLRYEDGILSWDAVENADAYIVEIDGVQVAEVTTLNYLYEVKTETTFRVAALSGAKRYQTSDFCEALIYKPVEDTRATLNAPTIIDINGSGVLVWSFVVNATGYRIFVNNSVVATVDNVTTYTLQLTENGSYSVQVQAIGNESYRDSSRSASYRIDVADAKIKSPALRSPQIEYDVVNYRVKWMQIKNAVGYDVYQNGTLVQRIRSDDATARVMVGSSYQYFYVPLIDEYGTRLYVVAVGDGVDYSDSTMSNTIAFPLVTEGVPTGLRTMVTDEGETALTWDKLDNCAAYNVKVEKGEEETVYTAVGNRLALPLEDGVYRISVAGKGDGFIFTSTEYSAQTEIDFVNRQPRLASLEPPQNAYVYKKTVYWGAVANAEAYQLLIDTPYDDSQGMYSFDVEDATFDIPAYLYESILTIYVRAVGKPGYDVSLWSKGTCYYPVNDEDNIYIEPTVDENGEYVEPAHTVYPDYSVQGIPLSFALNRDKLSWNGVSGASGYELVIDGMSYTLTDTSYALDLSVGHVCKVRALSDGENVLDSPYTEEIYVEKTRVSTPTDVRVAGQTLTWSSVSHTAGYGVQIDGTVTYVTGNSLDLSRQLTYDGSYTIRIYALSAYDYYGDSLYSRTLTYTVNYEESGTEHKPYKLATKEDLALLKQYPAAHFAMTNDIDVGETETMFEPRATFGGVLDGNGYSLTGIRTAFGESSQNGLLGYLFGATIKNVTFAFADVSADANTCNGLLAAEANQCTFENVTLTAKAVAGSSFGTVGTSTECVYRQCAWHVDYTQSNAAETVGGMVAVSQGDTFESCRVTGTLRGGNRMGAIAAVADNSAIGQCVMGTETSPFAFVVENAYAGCVGTGKLSECQADCNVTFTVKGNVYLGCIGGNVSCPIVKGNYTATVQAAAQTVYAGTVFGRGRVDIAECQANMTLTGSVETLYAGGIVGYAEGLCTCRETTRIALQVDIAATDGCLGGVVGFGTANNKGIACGDITVSEGVTVGRSSGVTQTESEEDWVVVRKE